jgi:hypothetical protein
MHKKPTREVSGLILWEGGGAGIFLWVIFALLDSESGSNDLT